MFLFLDSLHTHFYMPSGLAPPPPPFFFYFFLIVCVHEICNRNVLEVFYNFLLGKKSTDFFLKQKQKTRKLKNKFPVDNNITTRALHRKQTFVKGWPKLSITDLSVTFVMLSAGRDVLSIGITNSQNPNKTNFVHHSDPRILKPVCVFLCITVVLIRIDRWVEIASLIEHTHKKHLFPAVNCAAVHQIATMHQIASPVLY